MSYLVPRLLNIPRPPQIFQVGVYLHFIFRNCHHDYYLLHSYRRFRKRMDMGNPHDLIAPHQVQKDTGKGKGHSRAKNDLSAALGL